MPQTKSANEMKRRLATRLDPEALAGGYGSGVGPSTLQESWGAFGVNEPAAFISHMIIWRGGRQRWEPPAAQTDEDWLRRLAPTNLSDRWHSTLAEPLVEDSPVATAVEQAQWILDLPEDEYTGVGYEQGTLDRTADFLASLMKEARYCGGREVPVPAINPAEAGSVDLFWDLDGRQLLVNVSPDPGEPITFYGEDRLGTTVSGTRTVGDESPENGQREPDYLVAWLVTRG